MPGDGKRFTKGSSGNPGGRPKVAKVLAELGETLGSLAKECFEQALLVMRAGPQSEKDANWRYAHGWIADHTIGKAKEFVEITNPEAATGPSLESIVDQLDAEGLDALDVVLEQAAKAKILAAGTTSEH